MTVSYRTLALGGIGLLFLGFVFGRFSARTPGSKVHVEKIDAETVADVDTTTTSDTTTDAVATTTETTFRPDGTVERIVERVDVERIVEKVVEVEVEKIVEKIVYVDKTTKTEQSPLPQWRVATGLDLARDPLPIPGMPPGAPVAVAGSVERRLFGPVWIGAHGSTAPAVGLHIGFEF